jgi:phosphatidylserine decarboxylase
MVRDGYYYGLVCLAAALLLGWLTLPALAAIPILLGAFFLWFFRDPERQIPDDHGVIVSPADGKVTDVSVTQLNGELSTRISIFLNVFNVHVNRSPISGVIADARYQRGKFGNAMGAISAEENEQNIVTVRGDAGTVVFKQIAGLLARRIVFTKKVGDSVLRGERVGLIKFGSRVDVIFPATAQIKVKLGDHVAGGSSVLALVPANAAVPANPSTAEAR